MSIPTVSIKSTPDLLSAVPHLLGFTPSDSIVALLFDGRRLVVTSRVDAPTHWDAPLLRELVQESIIDRIRAREAVDSVILIGYDAAGAAAVQELVEGELLDVAVLSAVGVEAGTWRTLDHCDTPGCTIEHGGYVEPGAAATAPFVMRGSNPAPSRDAVKASMAPDPVDLPTPAITDDALRQGWGAILAGQAQPEHLAVVSYAGDPTARDAFVGGYLTGAPEVTACLPDEWVTWAAGLPVLPQHQVESNLLTAARAGNTPTLWTVLAHFYWACGDGAMTRIALDYALAVGPDYRLAQLLDRLITFGIRITGTPRWASTGEVAVA